MRTEIKQNDFKCVQSWWLKKLLHQNDRVLTASHASASSGDKRHRAGLPAAPAAGVPRLPARAYAGLLAEGASQPAEVLRRGGGARQADPKPHLSESNAPRGTEVRLDKGEGEGAGAVECHSGTSWWV